MKKKVILSIAAIFLTGCTQKDITHDFRQYNYYS